MGVERGVRVTRVIVLMLTGYRSYCGLAGYIQCITAARIEPI
jgi:hypothetical protein